MPKESVCSLLQSHLSSSHIHWALHSVDFRNKRVSSHGWRTNVSANKLLARTRYFETQIQISLQIGVVETSFAKPTNFDLFCLTICCVFVESRKIVRTNLGN
mmetsp:Transcript_69198/g.184421  ORF Transcript_69198/g.184421 Transcript_69198/m.184421 type:complete len:102 (-) Transcript_69198:9-314(-)